jgi:hypothetical protein
MILDKSSTEARAVKDVWPFCQILLCKFHRIQVPSFSVCVCVGLGGSPVVASTYISCRADYCVMRSIASHASPSLACPHFLHKVTPLLASPVVSYAYRSPPYSVPQLRFPSPCFPLHPHAISFYHPDLFWPLPQFRCTGSSQAVASWHSRITSCFSLPMPPHTSFHLWLPPMAFSKACDYIINVVSLFRRGCATSPARRANCRGPWRRASSRCGTRSARRPPLACGIAVSLSGRRCV